MHILQLANFYGPRSGGLRTAIDELGRRYAAEGHRVTLVVPAEVDRIEHEGWRKVIAIRSPIVPGMGGYRAIVDRWAVVDVIRELGPDIIELSDKTTLARVATSARRRRVPVVLVSHEHIESVLSHVVPRVIPLQRFTRRLNRRLASRVDAVVCASDFAAEEFGQIDAGIVRRIALGVDLDVFRPLASATAPGSRIELVCMVRLSTEKCPRLALDTVRVLAARGLDVRLTMIGDGPQRAELERRAAGLAVRFLGHVDDRRTIAWHLASAAAVIAPGPYETFGLGALEALASGTAVVVPDTGALRELVTPGTGVIVGHSPAEFAAGVETLLDGNRESQRRLARARAEQFSWEAAAQGFLGLFESLLAHVPLSGRLSLATAPR